MDIAAELAAFPHANIVIIGSHFDTRAILPGNRYLEPAPHYETWCVEPMQHCVRKLQKLANPRLHVVPFAVSDYDGEGMFYQHPAQDVTNSLRLHAAKIRQEPITTTMVPVRRLDTLLEEGLLPTESHYVTLDVQGLSLEALRGGQKFFEGVHIAWVESEDQTLYEGEKLYPEVKVAFEAAGFDEVLRRPETSWWGDSLFVNRRFKRDVDQ